MRGRNKLLVKVEGKPIIFRVIEASLKSKIDEVIVVLGWHANDIKKILGDVPCRFVLNKAYEKGQSSSVKAGLKQIGKNTEAILILPGDIAMIDFESINLVIDEFARSKAPIVIASHDGSPGHPILFEKQLFGEIEDIDEKTFGLKAVVNNHSKEIRLVEAGSSRVLKDVDTPQDLKNL